MKMSELIYQKEVSEPIIAFLSQFKEDDIEDARNNVPYSKDQFVSFVWLIGRKAKVNFGYLYNQGLNDTHIETALKKCLNKYKG